MTDILKLARKLSICAAAVAQFLNCAMGTSACPHSTIKLFTLSSVLTSKPQATLHEAARLANPLNEFHDGTCKCKSKCTTNKCPCKKEGAPCSSKCHGGQKCSNNSQPPKCQSTESTTNSSKWLHLDIHDKDVCEGGAWLTDKHMQAAQNLLQKQFPHVQGLQPTVYDQGSKWTPMTSGGVQLLNQSNTHSRRVQVHGI